MSILQTANDEMRVIKRNGDIETVSFDKILRRIKTIGQEAGLKINWTQLAMKVIDQLYDKISTTKIDELTADQCAAMSSQHYDYGTLAAHIVISNHHKNTSHDFREVVRQLYNFKDIHGKHSPLVSQQLYEIVEANSDIINSNMDYSRDYVFDYFGFKTLEKSYLMRIRGKVVERPQHMWMRVSLCIHGEDIKAAFQTYSLMSQKYFTHATPTLFNSGTPRPQLSSCFLIAMEEDSISGIYNTLKDCALISKWAGGIGMHIHNIRASGSHIHGTNGSSNGIVPMLRVFNNTAKYVDQCLTPDSIIYCKDGKKCIKDVIVGDEVLNDDGIYRPVSNILNYPNYSGPLYTIKIHYENTTSQISVTDMHPFWTKRGWVSAKDLQQDDTIGFVEPLKNINSMNYKTIASIEFEKEYTGRVLDLEVLCDTNLNNIIDNDEIISDHHNFMTSCGLVHNGGGKRNGSFAIYLEPWHADIELFLEMRKNHGDEELKARDLFYALWVPDLFMERVKQNGKWTLMCPNECPGLADVHSDAFKSLYESYEAAGKGRKTVQARDLWFKVLDAQMETGTPYLCYKDAVNRKSNQQNVGTIKSSNLCVASDTLILTDNGHIQISLLEGKRVNVWNGEEFSDVQIVKTGENQELIDVFTDDGCILSCTPYHKFYIQTDCNISSIKQVEAKDLTPNDKIIKCNYPIINGTTKMKYAYTHGFFCGDGTYGNITENKPVKCKFKALPDKHYCKRHIDCDVSTQLNVPCENEFDGTCQANSYEKKPLVYLYDEKKKLIEFIDYRSVSNNSNRIVLCLPLDIDEKYYVPSFECCLEDKLLWFAGYCDADGSIARNGSNEQLQLTSINYSFLYNIKLMLQTLGINPKLKLASSREFSLLPDGNGGEKYYSVKPLYRLLLTSYDLHNLVNLGFKTNRLNFIGAMPARNAKQFVKIIKVENNNRVDDTYCFTEPKRGMGIFNGIITGQCAEIVEYSDENETAVCNLASIGLPTFVDPVSKTFDYAKLHEVTQVVAKNLNKVIDVNFYPTEKTRISNMRHRPIGIGVQGLADVFMLMDVAFHSDTAQQINQTIFETIYHGALTASCDVAKTQGAYETFAGSPASQGRLQYDLWGTEPKYTIDMFDWAMLKSAIMEHGLRNSLLVAPMPTASTSQILGFNECFEPFTSNIYSRRTLAGEFVLTNKYLMRDLIHAGMWNTQLKNSIIANQGSVQHIEGLSQHLKDKYKTVWEIPMRHLIDMAANRGAFICQSQSLNLWMEDPNYGALTSMHFHAWQKGLKTGIYYLRRRAKHRAQQFTIEPEKKTQDKTEEKKQTEEEGCTMCSA